MKTCTKCGVCKSLDSFSKQAKGKFGVTSICKRCSSERGKAWHRANRDKSLALKRSYHIANRELNNKRSRDWRGRHPSRARETAAAWLEANRDKKNAATARRRAAVLQAIPPWANLDEIKHFYRWAREATEATGIEFQVDHIYPLQSDVVCGLHCWDNLMLRTATSNKSKGNRV